MPVWTVCLWIPWSPKQKQMWLIQWSSVTLLLVNNWYPGTARGERRHKVLNLSTSIMCPFSGCPTFSKGSGSAGTCCSVSILVTSWSGGHWGQSCCCCCCGCCCCCCCCSWGGRCDWSHLALFCVGVTLAMTGLTLATIAAERGLAVRPRWTVSQPSASFLPGEHMRYCVNQEKEDALLCSLSNCIFSKYTVSLCGGDFLPSFSKGKEVGWLELGIDWVHFTRSAQLGPVWESRAAASVAGGPLNRTHTLITHESK